VSETLTPRERAILRIVSEKPGIGLNALTSELRRERLASDKRQVKKALENLERLGLLDIDKQGQRWAVKLSEFGELYLELERVKDQIESINPCRISKNSEVVIFFIEKYLGYRLTPAQKRLIIQRARQVKPNCELLASTAMDGIALAGFLIALLRKRGITALIEPLIEHMQTIVDMLEECGCMKEAERLRDKKIEAYVKAMRQALEHGLKASTGG